MQVLLEKIRRKAAQLSDPGHGIMTDPDATVSRATDRTPEVPELFLPYLFLDRQAIRTQFTFSSEGIPIRFARDRRAYTNWLCAGYYGLICLNAFLKTGDSSAKHDARQMAEFLLGHGTRTDNAYVLPTTVDLPKYHLVAPWVSCLSQAVAALLCLRLSRHGLLIEGRKHALAWINGMLLPITQGGSARQTPEGIAWLEEYPGKIPSLVLNGFLFAVIAIVEYNAEQPRELGQQVDTHLDSLLRCFPLYQYGRYLRYDRLHGALCNPQYMGLQTLQFYHLYRLTGIKQIGTWARELHHATHWPIYFRSFDQPLREEHMSWLERHLRQLSAIE